MIHGDGGLARRASAATGRAWRLICLAPRNSPFIRASRLWENFFPAATLIDRSLLPSLFNGLVLASRNAHNEASS